MYTDSNIEEDDMVAKAHQKTDEIRTQLITVAVALEFGIPHKEILTKTKGTSRVAFGRQLCMYLLNIVYDVNVTRVGRAFSRDRSTASHACQVIEEMREDPVLDRKIQGLETFLKMAPYPETHMECGV